jgi:protein-disulfide isomerase
VQEHAYLIPINKSPVLGKPDAKTNIVVFSNFECPYCSRADGLLRQIVADPELKDHVNLVFKHFPFDRHKLARPAAKAALAAGEQGKFWEMSELIFANQPNLSEENFKKWAQQIGLDLNKFNSDLKDHDKKYDEQINEDIKIGTETAKLKGTPWITIGGWLFEVEPMNAQSVKDFIKAKNL